MSSRNGNHAFPFMASAVFVDSNARSAGSSDFTSVYPDLFVLTRLRNEGPEMRKPLSSDRFIENLSHTCLELSCTRISGFSTSKSLSGPPATAEYSTETSGQNENR